MKASSSKLVQPAKKQILDGSVIYFMNNLTVLSEIARADLNFYSPTPLTSHIIRLLRNSIIGNRRGGIFTCKNKYCSELTPLTRE